MAVNVIEEGNWGRCNVCGGGKKGTTKTFYIEYCDRVWRAYVCEEHLKELRRREEELDAEEETLEDITSTDEAKKLGEGIAESLGMTLYDLMRVETPKTLRESAAFRKVIKYLRSEWRFD